MKKLAVLIFSFAVILLLPSCSPKEVTKDNTPKNDSTYVFDQVPKDTTKHVVVNSPAENIPVKGSPQYIVQMGAFSTKDKAETFTAMAKQKLNREMVINFNSEKNLYIVQLDPPFSSRPEAEQVRDNVKQFQEYKDAWIVTVIK
jgi:cell division protein FtsN